MAQDKTQNVAEGTWEQLTDADISALTFQNQGPGDLYVKVTASASAPTTFAGALLYKPGAGEVNVALSDLAPGITGARVYGYAATEYADVVVSHA